MLSLGSFAQEIKLTGVYQGKNIYVQNPLKADQRTYCTEAVYVNGSKILDNPRSSSYEINLSKFAINAPLEIRIVHSKDCKPKVINKYVIEVKTKFKFISFTADDKSLNWTVEGESSNSVYYVEQFSNNNWTNIKVLTAQAQQNTNSYSLPVSHSTGQNTYRIKHQEKSGQIAYSQTISYNSVQGMVKFYPRNVSNKIYFTANVSYEISNVRKQIIKKGKGKEVDLSNLQRGVYYISFDNRTEQFLKK
ncbi:MAG: hypothetical protein OHK0045_08300 [Raineya sp.]